METDAPGSPAPIVRPSFTKVFALCNFPFLLLFLAQVSFCIDRVQSGLPQGEDSPATTYIKYALTAWLALLFVTTITRLTPLQVWYLVALAGVFLWNLLLNTYSLPASLTALARYSTPLLFLFHGYFYRHRLDVLMSAVFAITIANDVVQCLMYAAFFCGAEAVPMHVLYGLLPRASGMAGLVAFSLMNFTCAVLAYYCLEPKNRLKYCTLFLCFTIASFSFKLIPALLLFAAMILRPRGRAALARILLVSLCLGAVALVEDSTGAISQAVNRRYENYAVGTETARRDSYRVMWESLGGGNLLGEGLGYFGGPASTRYDSPAYQKYAYFWGSCFGITTTDTYYPHVFVELGLLGGTLYLAMFGLPLLQSRRHGQGVLAPYFLLCFALFVNSLASFSIQSFDSLLITSLLSGLAARDTHRAAAPALHSESFRARWSTA